MTKVEENIVACQKLGLALELASKRLDSDPVYVAHVEGKLKAMETESQLAASAMLHLQGEFNARGLAISHAVHLLHGCLPYLIDDAKRHEELMRDADPESQFYGEDVSTGPLIKQARTFILQHTSPSNRPGHAGETTTP